MGRIETTSLAESSSFTTMDHRSQISPPRSCGLWAGGAAVPSGVRHLPLHPQDALCRHPKECLQGVAVYLCLHVLVYLVAQANMWSPDLCVCLTNEKCLQPGNCLGSLRNPPPLQRWVRCYHVWDQTARFLLLISFKGPIKLGTLPLALGGALLFGPICFSALL